MTPLQKAQQILEELQALATSQSHVLPGTAEQQYAMVGNQVVACAGVTVNVVGSNPQPLNPLDVVGSQLQVMECGPAQLGIFTLVIARECANISNNDGTDNVDEVARVSALMDADGQLLWDFAVNYDAWISKTWTSRFAIEGALGVSSLQLTTGVD